jgi:hypothetical protein
MAIVEVASNSLTHISMDGATTGVGVRHVTDHAFLANSNFIAMVDGASHTYLKLPVTNNSAGGILIQDVAINQTTGWAYIIPDGRMSQVIGVQDLPAGPLQYTLTVGITGMGGGNVVSLPGGIDCGLDCLESYTYGTVVTLTASPFISSTFTGWSGAVMTPTNPVTLTLDAAKGITATFAVRTYTITLTAGANGSISPSTPQTVNYGASRAFTITANTGYHILDVGVDGVSQGAVVSYTFTNVTANHALTATFAINTSTNIYLPLILR